MSLYHPFPHAPLSPSWRTAFTLAMAGMCLAGCHKESSETSEGGSTGPKVQGTKIVLSESSAKDASITTAIAKPLEKSILTVNGRLVWDESSTVSVFTPVAGRVSSIDINLGEKVRKDQTLARIFSPDFGQAEADAAKADADNKLSKRTLDRTTDLLKHGAAAQKDVEAAQDDFENKEAELKRAVARLELYGGKLGAVNGLYPLQAPIGGTLVEKHINPGQEVRPDQMLANLQQYTNPLFVISDPSKLSVLLDVTELDLNKLKAGQVLTIHSRAYPDSEFHGKLEVIGHSLDPQTRTIYARGSVDNPDGLLKAEMYVGVEVGTGVEATPPPSTIAADPKNPNTEIKATDSVPVEIPVKALFSKESHHYVFLEKNPGEFERHSVEVGTERDGKVAVLSGLKPGERVVTDGCLLLESLTEGGGSKD